MSEIDLTEEEEVPNLTSTVQIVRLKCVVVNMEKLIKLIVISFLFLGFSVANLVHKKFEYKYSFKPPYLAQKDGSVPFWEYGGSK